HQTRVRTVCQSCTSRRRPNAEPAPQVLRFGESRPTCANLEDIVDAPGGAGAPEGPDRTRVQNHLHLVAFLCARTKRDYDRRGSNMIGEANSPFGLPVAHTRHQIPSDILRLAGELLPEGPEARRP